MKAIESAVMPCMFSIPEIAALIAAGSSEPAAPIAVRTIATASLPRPKNTFSILDPRRVRSSQNSFSLLPPAGNPCGPKVISAPPAAVSIAGSSKVSVPKTGMFSLAAFACRRKAPPSGIAKAGKIMSGSGSIAAIPVIRGEWSLAPWFRSGSPTTLPPGCSKVSPKWRGVAIE